MTKRLNEHTPQELLQDAYEHAANWLNAEMNTERSCFLANPLPNFGRGVEFYSGLDLYRLAAFSIAIYASGTGRWPSLTPPVRMTEKQLWSKFFGFMPLPTPADKLTVGQFLPAKFRDRINLPEIVWRSNSLTMPPSLGIPAGRYLLKTNNDSGTNLEVRYPLTSDQKTTIAKWLQHRSRGAARLIGGGEWWYGKIKPEIFLEKTIGTEDSSPEEWKLHVMNGRCSYLYERQGDGPKTTAHTVYDRDFNHVPISVRNFSRGQVRDSLDEYPIILEAAETIASNMSFARVDFYRTVSGELFLGEVTFCPNNAINWFSDPDFDEKIGAAWDHKFKYKDDR